MYSTRLLKSSARFAAYTFILGAAGCFWEKPAPPPVVPIPATATPTPSTGPTTAVPKTIEELGETPFPGIDYPAALNARSVHRAAPFSLAQLPSESKGNFGMGPHATPAIIDAALKQIKTPQLDGPFKENWQSIADNHELPAWINDGKFGIFLHFGLYSVGAHHNEWYEQHMYARGGDMNFHIQAFGPLDVFGYKDFIPKFTLPNFKPEEWAKLFKDGGAAWAMPTGEHHDGFSLWESKANKFNSVAMGPHRDVVGDLAKAVRAEGLHYGVTLHTIEHYDFIHLSSLPEGVKTDLDSPGFEDFYWTHHSDEQMARFLAQWEAKTIEVIDQYKPDVLWFDNGINHRMYDPIKLKMAAYYYNRAKEWGKEVTLTGKGTAWIAGGLQDFETMGRAPRDLTDYTWFVHDKINRMSWGWVDGDTPIPPQGIVNNIVEVVSRNGIFGLNLSPKGDGSIPDDQQKVLRQVGQWLKTNGEAIYGTRPWTKAGEGALPLPRGQRYSAKEIRFTTKAGALNAIVMAWPADGQIVITSLPANAATGKPTAVTMFGSDAKLEFTQDAEGLKIKVPAQAPSDFATAFKIEGLKL